MVGETYTLRYIAAREDLKQIMVFQNPAHSQRKAVEECRPDAGLVFDSRKDALAASVASILISRLMVRDVAGAMADGGLRGSPEIAAMSIPAYHHRASVHW
ncbi:hypothetical protein G5B35_01640 [Parapusillimonas sp. SGNA-6]|nr:hypothetical protein [Parapusillimonas sp. SGNA-6]